MRVSIRFRACVSCRVQVGVGYIMIMLEKGSRTELEQIKVRVIRRL